MKEFAVLTIPQREAIAYSRCVSGSLSVIASATLIRKVWARKDRTTYHRILGSLSIVDVFFSFWAALATLPVPPETGAVGAHGNTASCAAQGFFVQWGSITLVYMASLSIYFLLRIRYSVKDSEMNKKVEVFLHGVPLVFMLVTCFVGLGLEIFNPIGLPELGCWLAAYPVGCGLTAESVPCERGQAMVDHFVAIVFGFSHGPLWTSVFVILVANILINKTIRDQDKRNSRYATTPAEEARASTENTMVGSMAMKFASLRGMRASHVKGEETGASAALPGDLRGTMNARQSSSARLETSKNAKAAAVQSFLYVFSAFLTTSWNFLVWLGYHLQAEPKVRFYFALFAQIIFPLQGVFNLIIFVRPRYIRHRKEEPEVSMFRTTIKSLCEAP